MTVQAFPVRFAETVNRFGSTRLERLEAQHPDNVFALVSLGGRSVVARTYGERVTRRGRQTLVYFHGRLTWMDSDRVQVLTAAA